MDFTFTEEHEQLRDTVRRFLEKESTEPAVRQWMATDRGYDDAVWTRLADEMGLPGLIVPEEHGGAGLGPVELAVVMEEMGRVLYCGPYLSTAVLAASAILEAGSDEAKSELLPGIASGKTIATVALAEAGGVQEPSAIRVTAKPAGGSWTIDGEKRWVLDGHLAEVLLVVARTDEGLGLFRIDPEGPGVGRSLVPTLDLTRKLAHVRLEGARAGRVDAGGDATAALERAFALAVTALACEQAGGTQRCLEISTGYAKTRLQFGRPIGTFQAIKHRCADMLVESELARSAALAAAFAAAGGDGDELRTSAHLARAYCSEAYFNAAAGTIQIHGGMGFTWEHCAHLYFKRAKSSAILFGTPDHHRERLAHRVGI